MSEQVDETIKAGTFITFDHGEYSDRGYTGPFVVKKDFLKEDVAAAYRAQWVVPDDGWPEEPDEHGFIVWMHKEGYIEDVNSTSWHIGSYGRFEP